MRKLEIETEHTITVKRETYNWDLTKKDLLWNLKVEIN